MTKAELIKELAERTELTQVSAEKFYTVLLEIITEELANGNDVVFKGFGTFGIGQREERKGRNPQNGQELTIPATKYPKFKASKCLKKEVNN